MSILDILVSRLSDESHREAAWQSLVAHYTQHDKADELFGRLVQYLEEGMPDGDTIAWLSERVEVLLGQLIRQSRDPNLVVALKLRLSKIMLGKRADSSEALVLAAEATSLIQSGPGVGLADILRGAEQNLLLMGLLERQAQDEVDSSRRSDLLIQLGFVALGLGYASVARGALRELGALPEAQSSGAAERLSRAVDKKVRELEQRRIDLRLGLYGVACDDDALADMKELGSVLVRLGEHAEAIPLLERAIRNEPSLELFVDLREAYRRTGSAERLCHLLGWLADQCAGDDRKELLKERALVLCEQVGDVEAGVAASMELWSEYIDEVDVGRFCAELRGKVGDFEGQALVIKRLGEEAGDREVQLDFMEEEAELRWRALGQWDDAEKLFRRVRAVRPRSRPATLFYEALYRKNGDVNRLFRILSARVSMVPPEEKVPLLREMVELSLGDEETPDRAISALKQLLVLCPDDHWAFSNLSRLLEQSGRWQALAGVLVDSATLPSTSPEERKATLLRVAGIYADRMDNLDMALSTLRTILTADPKEPGSLALRARILRQRGDWELYVKAQTERLELGQVEGSQSVLELKAELARVRYLHLFGGEDVIPDLERAVEELPDDVETLRVLMMAYRDRGDLERLVVPGSRLFELYLESLVDIAEPEDQEGRPQRITLVYGQDIFDLEESTGTFEAM